jgi:hypothetical protein
LAVLPLPYLIELWNGERRDDVELVLARASSAELARALFKAAMSEHPYRRITLCKGSIIIADSSAEHGRDGRVG